MRASGHEQIPLGGRRNTNCESFSVEWGNTRYRCSGEIHPSATANEAPPQGKLTNRWIAY